MPSKPDIYQPRGAANNASFKSFKPYIGINIRIRYSIVKAIPAYPLDGSFSVSYPITLGSSFKYPATYGLIYIHLIVI